VKLGDKILIHSRVYARTSLELAQYWKNDPNKLDEGWVLANKLSIAAEILGFW